MSIVKPVAGVVAGLAGIFVVGGLVLPKEVEVQRSIVVNAPVAITFAQVNDLTQHEAWSPWKAADDTMHITMGPITEGEGATFTWTSEHSGDGAYRISKVDPPHRLESDLDFRENGTASGWWTFTEEKGGTAVTWGFFSDDTPLIVGPWVNLMVDSMVGGSFELGLAQLKAHAEEAAAAAVIAAEAASVQAAKDRQAAQAAQREAAAAQALGAEAEAAAE